jgi:cation diffusion facilitator family transporter
MSKGGSNEKRPLAVYAAMVANFLIAVTKFIAAVLTGSSAMISEGIHSLADTGNQALLLLGVRNSRQPANETHPFGQGKELYFWGLIVAMVLFGLGGGMSIYEGISHLQHPSELTDPTWNYVVLGIAFLFEGISWGFAMHEFLPSKEPGQSLWQALRASKDPTIFVVVFEDSAALLGLLFALGGVFLSHQFQAPAYDGIASIFIGLLLSVVAVYLAYETRSLLIGESADSDLVRSVHSLAEADRDVVKARTPLTMHFGPDEILINMDLQFAEGLSGDELVTAINRVEKQIRKRHPQVSHVFIEAGAVAGEELGEEEG